MIELKAGVTDVSLQSALTWAACVQRVVLLSFDKDTGRISFRHFGISAAPSGVTRSVKQLVNRRQLPNMGALGDVSELLTKSGYGSVWTGPLTVALAPAIVRSPLRPACAVLSMRRAVPARRLG